MVSKKVKFYLLKFLTVAKENVKKREKTLFDLCNWINAELFTTWFQTRTRTQKF